MGIGLVLDRMGKYEDALVEHHKALEVFLAVFGSEHPLVAASHVNMGTVYDSQGRYEEALVQYQQALAVFLAVHGQEHLDVANSYYGVLVRCPRQHVVP